MNENEMESINLDDKVVTYLQMIQSAIDRMSTSSSLFKGFAATIITGISAVSLSSLSYDMVIFAIIPLILFAIMDIYYLQLEKRYRFLYSQISSGKVKSTFEMVPPKVKDILQVDKKAKVRWFHCLRSPSIYLFYFPLLLACIALLIVIISKVPITSQLPNT